MHPTIDDAFVQPPDEGGWMDRLERLSAGLNRLLEWAAGFALLGMMLFTVADVALREFGRPIAGSYEVIGWLAASAMALVLGSVQQHRGHVAVELLAFRFGPRLRALVGVVNGVLALLLFGLVAWHVARYGSVLQMTGSTSETLRVVVYPWVYGVAAGFIGLVLALLVDLLRAVGRLVASVRS